MSTGRFAALLGVLLVIGVAGVAQAADGDPLILGTTNSATGRTNVLGGPFEFQSLRADELSVPGRDVFFKAGQQTMRIPCPDAGGCGGSFVLATLQRGSAILYVQRASLNVLPTGGSEIVIRLSGPAQNSTEVFYTVVS